MSFGRLRRCPPYVGQLPPGHREKTFYEIERTVSGREPAAHFAGQFLNTHLNFRQVLKTITALCNFCFCAVVQNLAFVRYSHAIFGQRMKEYKHV